MLKTALIFTALLPVCAFSSPSTLNCKAIQKQIDGLPKIGGEVIVAAGTYICDSPIVLNRSHVSLRGNGSVKLKLSDKANAPVIIMGDTLTPPKPLEDIRVENFKIYGNKEHQQYECWGGECDGGGTKAIRNNGISVRNLRNGQIKNVYVNGARSGGVVSERGTSGLHVQNLESVQNYFDGLAGCNTTNSVFENLNLQHNNAAGLSIDVSYNNNTFKNVKILNNHDVGLFMRFASNNVFKNMTVDNSGSFGLLLAQSEAGQETCPQNNEFIDLQVTHSKKEAFRLNDHCKNNHLAGAITLVGNKGCLSELISGELKVDDPSNLICRSMRGPNP